MASGNDIWWIGGPDSVVPAFQVASDDGTTARVVQLFGGMEFSCPSTLTDDGVNFAVYSVFGSLPAGWNFGDLFWDSNSDQIYVVLAAIHVIEPSGKGAVLGAINKQAAVMDTALYITQLPAQQNVSRTFWSKTGLAGR